LYYIKLISHDETVVRVKREGRGGEKGKKRKKGKRGGGYPFFLGIYSVPIQGNTLKEDGKRSGGKGKGKEGEKKEGGGEKKGRSAN